MRQTQRYRNPGETDRSARVRGQIYAGVHNRKNNGPDNRLNSRRNEGTDSGRNSRRNSGRNSRRNSRAAVQKKRMLLFAVCIAIAFFMGRLVGKAEKYHSASDIRRHILKNGERSSDPGQEGLSDADGGETSELILVNKEHPLPEDYAVDLVTLPDRVHKGAAVAYEPLCEMLKAGRQEGLSFEICSAYRDSRRQSQLFEEDVNALMAQGYSYEAAYEEVAKETMPPGCSEHSTGLAFDIVASDYQLLDAGQADTAEGIWLREHCAEYGFILRYPKDKEDITQISYESWHFRYVGKTAAKEIMERQITLEEYLEGQADIL